MSNVALFGGSNVPAFVKARGELSAVAKALAGGGAAGGKRISIKGGVFRLMSAGKEIAAIDERYLDVVIVNAAPKVSRTFYMASYDADKVAAPDCWSADGITPDPEASNRQSTKCDGCPQNIQGSGNGKSKACRYQQRLAVVLANDMEGDVLQMTVPGASVFGDADGDNRPLQAFARYLTAQNVEPTEVVVRMKFDTKAESPKLFFKAMRWLTDEEHEIVQNKSKSDDAIKAITMTVAKQDGVVSKPVEETLSGKRPAKAAPAPQAEEDDEPPAPAPKAKKAKPVAAEDDGDEPVVRKEEKKPNAVPAKKSSLAAMVDDWDDNE